MNKTAVVILRVLAAAAAYRASQQPSHSTLIEVDVRALPGLVHDKRKTPPSVGCGILQD